MSDSAAVMRESRFTSLRYRLEPNREKGPFQIHISIQAKFGRYKEDASKKGAVTLQFLLEDKKGELDLSGDFEVFFDLEKVEGAVDNNVVRQLCFRPAYEEFRRRLKEVTSPLGGIKAVELKPFEQITVGDA